MSLAVHGDLLDGFVVGPCNRDAYRSIRRAVDRRGGAGSAVLLHGPSGVGKTRLLSAAARAGVDQGRRVHHVGAADLVSQLLSDIRSGHERVGFDRWRSVDLIVIDQLEVLAGRRQTTVEIALAVARAVERGAVLVAAESTSRSPDVSTEVAGYLTDRGYPSRLVAIDSLDPRTRRRFIRRALRDSGVQLARKDRAALGGVQLRTAPELSGLVTRIAATYDLDGPAAATALAKGAPMSVADQKGSSGSSGSFGPA